MFLLARFFSPFDLMVFPFCLLLLFIIFRNRVNTNKDPRIRKLFYRAFAFKIICVLAFTLLTEFYFKGGDTGLYYQATQDLRAAIKDNPDNFWLAMETSKLTWKSPLFDYFYYDNYEDDLTYNYMLSRANFTAPKIALIPSYIFGNSYLCISMLFGFFALGGAIRLFKTFHYYYPHLYRELGLACLFLPSVAYWSSGLLKDPICFGAIGFITYGFLNIFVRKRQIIISVLWILLSGMLLIFIKVYILLVLVMAILIWQFAEFNKLIKNKTLRNIFAGLTFAGSIGVAFLMLGYMTSMENAQQYQLDKLQGNIEYQQQMYAEIAKTSDDSHFEINTSNPVLMVLGGVSATFYRPFPWEVNSVIMLLSFLESFAFLLLTYGFMRWRGIKKFFTVPFSEPRILMCFVFAFVFAVAVGTASANFGALSRYKIPCMPFYLIMLILMYDKTKLQYPKWFYKVLNFAIPVRSKRL